MRKIVFASVATTVALACAAPAQALEHATPGKADEVASLKIGKTGEFGDCTGTLIDSQWIATARHCMEAVKNEGTQARFGQGKNTKVYNVDSWAVNPTADIALLHLDKKVEGIKPAHLAEKLPSEGEIGQFYGWSSSSHMARKKILPVADMKVSNILMLNQIEPGDMVQDSGSPVGGNIINAQSTTKAGVQGGDSGGPFFVHGKLVGVLTGSTGVDNLDLPTPGISVTSLVDANQWVKQIISGQDKDSIITPQTAVNPPKIAQEGVPLVKPTLIGGAIILLFAAIFSRVRRQKNQGS